MDEDMSNTLMKQTGGNMITLGICLILFLVYKKCKTCNSSFHTSWLDCETEDYKERKAAKHRENIKKALSEHTTETMRDSQV